MKAKAKELGVSEDAVRRDLETRRIADWSTPLSQASHDQQSGIGYGLARKMGAIGLAEPTRTLPDGNIMPNPELGGDRAEFDKAIDGSLGTKEAKDKARGLWDKYHDNYLSNVRGTLETMQTLPGVESYMDWRERMQKGEEFNHLSENQKAEKYMDEQKGRPWYRKLADNVSSNLLAGSHDLVAGIAGAGGLLTGSQTMSDFAAEKAGQAESTTAALQHTGNDGAVNNIIGGVARAVPGAVASAATGGAAGAAAMAFTQGAGGTYADLYQHHIDQGMTPEQAHRASFKAAAASGAASAALGGLFPGGANALNNPAAREAAKKSFGSVMKSFLKGAADEIPQEVIDGGFNHIVSEMNKGKTAKEAAASYLESLPETMATAGIMGGAVHAGADVREGSQGGSNTPPQADAGSGQQSQTTANNGQQSQTSSSLPPPTTPPKTPERSQKLIDNVSKMSAEAQQHLQVQADVAQAQQVLAEDAAQKAPQPPAANSAPPSDASSSGSSGSSAKEEASASSSSPEPVPAAPPASPAQQPAPAETPRSQIPDNTTLPSAPGFPEATGQPPQTTGNGSQPSSGPPTRPSGPAPSPEVALDRIHNILNMPPEQRGHWRTQQDLAQAQRALEDHVHDLERLDRNGLLSDEQWQQLHEAHAALDRLESEGATTTHSSSGDLPPGDSATTDGATPPTGASTATATGSHAGTGDTGSPTSTASTGDSNAPGGGTHTTNGVTAPEIGHGNLIPENTTNQEHIDLATRRAENLEEIARKRKLDPHQQEIYDNARRVRDRNAPAQPGDRNSGNPDDLAMAGDAEALVPVTPDGEDAHLDAAADAPPPAAPAQSANAIGSTINGSSSTNPDAPTASAAPPTPPSPTGARGTAPSASTAPTESATPPPIGGPAGATTDTSASASANPPSGSTAPPSAIGGNPASTSGSPATSSAKAPLPKIDPLPPIPFPENSPEARIERQKRAPARKTILDHDGIKPEDKAKVLGTDKGKRPDPIETCIIG